MHHTQAGRSGETGMCKDAEECFGKHYTVDRWIGSLKSGVEAGSVSSVILVRLVVCRGNRALVDMQHDASTSRRKTKLISRVPGHQHASTRTFPVQHSEMITLTLLVIVNELPTSSPVIYGRYCPFN
ncbi:hypothetical protein KQX54_017621 [Cotesia glomerata]|uniref:Uncharacterized protein n=1 Tax=Cotesia glomerata TaxID=32391 RepID=A0AAV7HY00_COTGL|nr:hypothetical protein KQX54_017621 [Cotesia glomerata]